MGQAPYPHRYQRARPADPAAQPGCPLNPASHLTDQGADPEPQDLAWCIRRRWRLIYYCARYAAGQPLWAGAQEFELVMADVLWRLSSAFKPIPPLADGPVRPEDVLADLRADRIQQRSCRIFRAPRFDRWRWPD